MAEMVEGLSCVGGPLGAGSEWCPSDGGKGLLEESGFVCFMLLVDEEGGFGKFISSFQEPVWKLFKTIQSCVASLSSLSRLGKIPGRLLFSLYISG